MKELRIQNKITQQEVANFLGMTRAAYTNLENGKRGTDFSTIDKLANYFSVSTDYLLERTDNPSLPIVDVSTDLLGRVHDLPRPDGLNEDGSAYIYIMGIDGDNKRILVPPDKVVMIQKMLEVILPELDKTNDNPDI